MWCSLAESIDADFIETHFVIALENYLSVAKSQLEIQFPVQIHAGLTGIENFSLAVNNHGRSGKALRDKILWSTEILAEKPAFETLAPFFDNVWKLCGIIRPRERQSALADWFKKQK